MTYLKWKNRKPVLFIWAKGSWKSLILLFFLSMVSLWGLSLNFLHTPHWRGTETINSNTPSNVHCRSSLGNSWALHSVLLSDKKGLTSRSHCHSNSLHSSQPWQLSQQFCSHCPQGPLGPGSVNPQQGFSVLCGHLALADLRQNFVTFLVSIVRVTMSFSASL